MRRKCSMDKIYRIKMLGKLKIHRQNERENNWDAEKGKEERITMLDSKCFSPENFLNFCLSYVTVYLWLAFSYHHEDMLHRSLLMVFSLYIVKWSKWILFLLRFSVASTWRLEKVDVYVAIVAVFFIIILSIFFFPIHFIFDLSSVSSYTSQFGAFHSIQFSCIFAAFAAILAAIE